MQAVAVMAMESEIWMEKSAVGHKCVEISMEKRGTTPQLMMVMVMVMEFGEVGGSERAPIGCHIVDLAAWLGNGTLRRHMRICATLIMNS